MLRPHDEAQLSRIASRLFDQFLVRQVVKVARCVAYHVRTALDPATEQSLYVRVAAAFRDHAGERFL